MTTSEEYLALCAPLRIRTLRVVGADGTVARASTVCCPRQERSVRLKECMVCDHGQRMSNNEAREPVMCCTDAIARSQASSTDHAWRGRAVAALTPLHDVMTVDVITVRDDLGILALTGLLLEHGIHGVPVVDAVGQPIGMVSRTDLVRDHFEHGCAASQASPWSALTDRTVQPNARRGPSAVVADIMLPMPITLREDSTLLQAAALMALEGIHRIPVVGADGQVVGLISSLDVAAWLARHDGYIA